MPATGLQGTASDYEGRGGSGVSRSGSEVAYLVASPPAPAMSEQQRRAKEHAVRHADS